jgi:hypothetical protein
MVLHSNTLRAGETHLRRLLGYMSLSSGATHSMCGFVLSSVFLDTTSDTGRQWSHVTPHLVHPAYTPWIPAALHYPVAEKRVL